MPLPRRRSIRLPNYDYSQPGGYFLTIVAYDHEHVFGAIVGGEMRASALGKTVAAEWARSATLRAEIELDVFQLMPNHLHGIVFLHDEHVPSRGPRARSVGAFVAGFKSAVTRRTREELGLRVPVWQRNYFERVIRNERELERIRKYIHDNPANWDDDPEHHR
jgi:REP element-mobilizing transposase RayT